MKYKILTTSLLLFFGLTVTLTQASVNSHGDDSHAEAKSSDQSSHGNSYNSNDSNVTKASHGGAAHWGYSGNEGSRYWGDLSSDYHICKAGMNQSPIDISVSADRGLDQLEFHYASSALAIINNGHTVQVNYSGNSYLVIGGKRYKLLQFHFHSPSEHTLHGGEKAMEMHLVHQANDGRLAVVGVMIESGHFNNALKDVWGQMPASAGGEHRYPDLSVNAMQLLPSDKAYYHYNGSLTTPPCSEGVNWFVLKDSIQLSSQQIKNFKNIVSHNARDIQPLHGRIVMHK